MEINSEEKFENILKKEIGKIGESGAKAEDISIIKAVDTLIERAYNGRASDIHIEPREEKTLVRFRIDGFLHNAITLPKNIHNLIVTRIKVLSRMRTDEHFAAQDGKFQAKIEGEKFDIRVSIIPVSEGENVVLRLLSEKAQGFDLEKLGLGEKDLEKVKRNIKRPFGMFLATGPTGCGKTTTIYAALKILNTPEINICTIEDPVEYDIPGASQIQVNPKTNLTFAKGLRAIVRQDPNIMMVGEIRDGETANIAINSALTGHLIFSTMHANTAATNLPRLIDMGIEPFLVASSVNIIVAQRLVRIICPNCIEKDPKALEKLRGIKEIKDIEKKLGKLSRGKNVQFWRGKGCDYCSQTGYLGRTGILEVLEMEENIQKLIMRRASADEIEKQAQKNGMTTMLEDGLLKVLSKITTLEELLRVTKG